MTQRVLITGVSGYVGSWCAQKALEAGYKVVGTVRDPTSKKCAFLRDAMAGKPGVKLSGRAASMLTLIKADLLSGEEFWDKEVFAGRSIDFVLHTASPYFSKDPVDENEYIRPAVEGTKAVLKAAVKHGVKHVVVTSSMAAHWDPMIDGKIYSPKDWSDPALQSAYGRSKTLAEQAAWDAVKGTLVKVSTIAPMFVIGPTLYTDKDLINSFESGEICVKIMTGKFSMVPRVKMGVSDVRDVALAHVRALSMPGAAGKRFILTRCTHWFEDICRIFSKSKPELMIPAKTAPSFVIKTMALWNVDMRKTLQRLDIDYNVDSDATKEILGIEWTNEHDSAKQMMDDLIELESYPSSSPHRDGAPKTSTTCYCISLLAALVACSGAFAVSFCMCSLRSGRQREVEE